MKDVAFGSPPRAANHQPHLLCGGRLLAVLGGFVIVVGMSEPAIARSFRPNLIPNGSTVGCAACHVNPNGGGQRTAFGNDVFPLVIGDRFNSNLQFWDAVLAAKDSDGDDFTNGEELGDPDGDGVPTPGAFVSNPGLESSTPPLPPDAFADWQDENFVLPSEANLAEDTADPDSDGLQNLVEFALKLNPRATDPNPFPPVAIDLGGEVSLQLEVRNDDPKLQVGLEVAPGALFNLPTSLGVTSEEPNIGEGFKRLRFTDVLSTGEASSRFFRWIFSRDP